MSANRSVQAAQRRRAGPQDGGMPGTKGPQPSINSAQLFANQARPGSGPNMPTGRLAGQQAALQQKQMQQPQMQQSQKQQQQNEGISGVNKMTIAQAITLITLRLGAVETKMMALEHETPQGTGISFDGQENMVLIDKNVIQSIVSRLESLEKRSTTGSGSTVSGPEVALLKQQFETVKQAVIQTKGSTVTIKTQVDSLKNELIETKELLSALQNLTMENSKKLMGFDFQNMGDFSDQLLDGNFLEGNALINSNDLGGNALINGHTLNGSGFYEIQDTTLITGLKEIVGTGLKEIVGTNLKKLIESEN